MRFDRKKFFDSYRDAFGRLTMQQVRGLEQLLSYIEADPFIKDLRWAAYILATVKRETADTYLPIHEYGSKSYFIRRYGGQTAKGKELGNDTTDEGYFYAGKGYPQTTGEANYEKAEVAIRREYPEVVAEFEKRTGRMFDLTVGDQPNDERDPQNMLDPVIAYATMSYGMRAGMFTGHKLSEYIKGQKCDYKNARRIINGTDHATEIANNAAKFETVLRNSKTSDSAAPAADQQPSVSANQPLIPATSNSAAEPPLSSSTTQPVKIENIENARIEPGPPPPDPKPVTVTKERTSIWTKIAVLLAALAGMGINIGNVVNNKLNEMDVKQLAYAVSGVAIIAVALWAYDRAQARAHEKTLAKIKTAEDPAKNTVELKG